MNLICFSIPLIYHSIISLALAFLWIHGDQDSLDMSKNSKSKISDG